MYPLYCSNHDPNSLSNHKKWEMNSSNAKNLWWCEQWSLFINTSDLVPILLLIILMWWLLHKCFHMKIRMNRVSHSGWSSFAAMKIWPTRVGFMTRLDNLCIYAWIINKWIILINNSQAETTLGGPICGGEKVMWDTLVV